MAAGPADAFSATPRGFGCYDRELISAAADNLWSSSVVATASTGASWVDEVHSSDPVEKRIEELKRKFHRGRQLQIKQLPREVTEEEIRELLAEWEVQSVTIQSGSARVALCSPEMLEEWDRNAVFTLRGQRISIVPSPTEMLLCVGRLPITYSDQQFHNLISAYGEVRRYFLMISEKTGDCKGYGFVEYVTKEAALQAKNALDGKQILDFTAVCDWLDSSHVTVRSLHSKCLYIDHLPSNYRDMGEFRRIFSTIVNPPYCQIALRNGCPQDWGLVEFINEDDAERTQQALDGYSLHGHRIRVSYYIPGVRAINLYLKLLNDGGSNKGKSALLPDPPAPAVFQQLQSLAKQNPVFAQNLQAIIMQQIQDLQKGKGVNTEAGKRQPYHKGPQVPFGSPSSNQPNSNLVKNAHQTALTLLLASQIQQNGGSPLTPGGTPGGSGQISPNSAAASTLQNQQLLAALQAMSKGNTGSSGMSSPNVPSNGGGLCNDHFLNGIPNMNGGHNLSALLGLASGNNMGGMGQMDQQAPGGIPHGFFQSNGLLMSPGSSAGNSCGSNSGKEDQWSSYKNNKGSGFGSNGMQKSPLLPSPSGLSSPTLDVPMDTGMNPSKSPPGDPLQAVWYSLFGQPSSPDSQSVSGNTSPLFMKSPMSNTSSSSTARSVDQLFGLNANSPSQQMRSTPPGFCGPNGNRGMNGMTGDFQEALNNLLSNPQSLCHILGGNAMNQNDGGSGAKSPIPFSNNSHQVPFQQGLHNGLLQQNVSHLQRQPTLSGGLDQGGVSNAILDLLMQSMKTDQGGGDNYTGMKHNTWSSGMSTPPSPIGNNRSFHNGHNGSHHGGQSIPQRSGSNGSSEMSSSSPRSPSYSPFPRSSNKGLLESGNGNVSPTPTPWSNPVLGSPPAHSGGFGGPQHHHHHHHPHHPNHHHHHHSVNFQGGAQQSRNIWGNHSLSPGANSMNNNNNNMMNNMGQKRKVNHESGLDIDGFLPASMGLNNGGQNVVLGASPNTLQTHSMGNPGDIANTLSNHYADTYFKKKKKN